MPIYKQTTEITNIDKIWTSISKDIVEVYFGDKNVFSVWAGLESPLPITILAAGEDLIDYRIFGNTVGGESVGERTVNLWNPNTAEKKRIAYNGGIVNDAGMAMNTIPVESGLTYYFYSEKELPGADTYWQYRDDNDEIVGSQRYGRALQRAEVTPPENVTKVIICFGSAWEDGIIRDFGFYQRDSLPPSYIPYGYKLPMVVRSENLFDKDDSPLYPLGYYLNSQGVATKSGSDPNWYITNYINVEELTTYYLIEITEGVSYGSYTCFYDSNKNFIGSKETRNRRSETVTTPQGCAYMCVSRKARLQTMIIMGDEIPDDYIPYYRDEENIYIGSDPLAEDEYVDFGEQKVYKRTSNLFDIRKVASNIVTITGDNEFQKAETEKVWYDLFDHQTSDSPTRKADTTKCLYLEAGTYTLSGTAKLPDDDYADLYYVLTAQSNGTILAATALPYTFTLAADNYITIRIGTTHRVNMSQIMITAGSETPSTYESYLTPTDPPVAIPTLPTIDGETIIDYNPSETSVVEPDKMYVKYRKQGT